MTEYHKVDKVVENIKFPLYFVLFLITHVLYGLLFFGVVLLKPQYVHILTVIFHMFICMFLMFRFNPWTKPKLMPYDGQVIFGSALILLFNVVFLEMGINIEKVITTINAKLGTHFAIPT